LLEQGENVMPVVKDFLRAVATNIQVIGNFGDVRFLDEVAQDTRGRSQSQASP